MLDNIVMKDGDTDKQHHDTENMILVAAEREFLCKGFAGARTTKIAEAAGVTHAMLHYYFRTKTKLFEKIVADKVALLQEALGASIQERDSPLEEVIKNVINRHLDFLVANPGLPRFLIEEIYSGSERSKLFLEQIQMYAPMLLKSLQAKIDDAVARGVFRKVDAAMLMLDIVSLNVFSFMAAPIVNAVLKDLTADADVFLALRKKENYDTIMKKLKP